jgi:hypothetical protein
MVRVRRGWVGGECDLLMRMRMRIGEVMIVEDAACGMAKSLPL